MQKTSTSQWQPSHPSFVQTSVQRFHIKVLIFIISEKGYPAMLKQLKLVASICCIAVLLTACQKDKEATKAEVAQPAATPASIEPAVQTAQTAPTTSDGQTDVFTYCESVGSIDQADARYTGEVLPEKLLQAMVTAQIVTADLPQLKEPGFVTWRCMDKKVMVCIVGANIPCEAKADTSKEPNEGMVEFCKTDQNATDIPAAATGRETVYNWSCKDGKPMVGEQHTQVDAQGYPASFWTAVAP